MSAQKEVGIELGKDRSAASLPGVEVEVSSDGNVIVHTDKFFDLEPALPREETLYPGIGAGFNSVTLNGAKVEVTDNRVIIYASNVTVKPLPRI